MKCLAGFAKAYPHIAYAILTMLLQQERQFVHRVTPEVILLFFPLEEAIRNDFLPYLLEVRNNDF